MTTNEIEDRIMSERREQPQPPTPPNPIVTSLRELDWLVDVVDGAAEQCEQRELRDDLWQEALEGAKRVRIAEPLMYTGETRDEFYARRQALDGLWNSFMANLEAGRVFPLSVESRKVLGK